MKEQKRMIEIVDALRAIGVDANTVDTGGGIEGIEISCLTGWVPWRRFLFGTAGPTWAAEVLEEEDGDTIGGIETSIDVEAEVPEVVAGILRALAEYVEREER